MLRGGRAIVALLSVVAALTGAWSTPLRAAAARLSELPAAWRDERGQAFDLSLLQGRSVVLTMAYATCHRVCPTTMQRLQQLQQDYDRRGVSAEFLVVGYDPDNDDSAAWRQYRRSRHLTRSNWHFLVGTRAEVEQLARQLGFGFWKYDQHVMHGSRIVHFDEHGVLVTSDEAPGTAEYTEVGQ
ncbi:MAG TPA: SCO family protein [Candidatus Dormibacteraeota bacterium]|nr:SCO family protein [Candidatus Dormibacteraeota bacterium]